MNPRYPETAHRAGHRCEYCHAPEAIFNFRFEVEHIVPTSRGGVDHEANWALACRACNLYKAAHLWAPNGEGQLEVLLFHPRQQTWSEHFEVDRQNGRIDGLTPCGRATVKLLHINGEMQIVARQQWIRLGLFG
jgi:hypothetical protein